MAAEIIDGKAIAATIHDELRYEVAELAGEGVNPRLVVFLVGDDPASAVYVRMKANACKKLGIDSDTITLPESTSEQELLSLVERENRNPQTHGILVQMPLPAQINADRIIEAVSPEKDVDGFHPVNKGRLQAGLPCPVPCTPAGVQQMLLRSGNAPAGKHVVIVGRSQIVGMPLALLLAQKNEGGNATVTICHSRTKNIANFTRNADIVVAAIGRANFITADMLSEHSVVIDVGVNRVDDAASEKGYRLAGDVDFAAAVEKVRAISPVPGGVGPMTIAMLMRNTVNAARLQHENARQ